jgi:hypothetical protein
VALTSNRPVAEVTGEILETARLLGGDFEIDPTPQEVWWQAPLDEDQEHASYDPGQVATFYAMCMRAALALGAFRGRVGPGSARQC